MKKITINDCFSFAVNAPVEKLTGVLYMYHCFYYTKDDEYGHICEYNHEIVFFNNKEDAQEYKEDFESNHYRLDGQYTYYSGGIRDISNESIY